MCLGYECNQTEDQDNYMENVAVCICLGVQEHTAHMCEYVHIHTSSLHSAQRNKDFN